MEKGDLRIGENTVVHCATEQDSVKVLTIGGIVEKITYLEIIGKLIEKKLATICIVADIQSFLITSNQDMR